VPTAGSTLLRDRVRGSGGHHPSVRGRTPTARARRRRPATHHLAQLGTFPPRAHTRPAGRGHPAHPLTDRPLSRVRAMPCPALGNGTYRPEPARWSTSARRLGPVSRRRRDDPVSVAVGSSVSEMAESEWYWCLDHKAAEPADHACSPENRMGPYASRDEAERWKERVADRNETWDREDAEWSGGE
jgi:hypothetical protein